MIIYNCKEILKLTKEMIKILDEMNGEYKVYVHINKINGKIYIGQTKQTLEKRYKNGYENCRYFWNALQKYGWDNFEHIILLDNLSGDMANIIEEALIKKYNSTNKNIGYNLYSGGLNHTPSDECRKRMSEARRGEKHWNYGRHWGDDFKKKLSEIHKGREVPIEWREKMSKSKKGKKFSEEHKKSISESKMGDKNPMYGKHLSDKAKQLRHERRKHILQYNLDGVFIKEWDSAEDISVNYNVDLSNIVRCCIGELKSCCGFIWEYKNGDIIPQTTIPYKDRIKENCMTNRYKKVYKYAIDGHFIDEYECAQEVENIYGTKAYLIKRCCDGETYVCDGFRWSYEKVDKLDDLKDTNYYKGKMIPVVQLDTDWNFINEWESISVAGKNTHIDSSSISRCCKEKQKLAGGFRWKYKSDYQKIS